MKREKNGFTLAELLIVVAIIAVLVAVAIPLFTSQLEKSRKATDLSNVRAAYAEVMADAMSNHSTGTYSRTVPLKQKTKDWQTEGDITIGGSRTHKVRAIQNTGKEFPTQTERVKFPTLMRLALSLTGMAALLHRGARLAQPITSRK